MMKSTLRTTSLISILAAAAMVSGCDRMADRFGGSAASSGGQAAARVGKSEISVHQVNYVLQRQARIPGNNRDAASRVALDRLVSQELAVQQARTLDLQRKPDTMMALEAAQREVLAQSYLDSVTKDLPSPTDADIGEFFDKHPLLFGERKVYLVQEVTTAAPATQLAAVQEALARAPEFNAFLAELKRMGIAHSRTLAERGADLFPLDALAAVARLAPGQSLAAMTPQGVAVYFMQSSRPEPLTLEQSKPVIQQFLAAERRRKVIEERMAALRATTPVQYLGPFAAASAAAPSASTTR